MKKTTQATERRAPEQAQAKKPFQKPVLERHDSLPEVTGFSF